MNKTFLRKELKKIRQKLSPQRREEAADQLLSTFLSSLVSYETVLSFVNLPQEIDISSLNRSLAISGRLLLPRVVGENLKIYRVTHYRAEKQYEATRKRFVQRSGEKCELEKQLEQNTYGLWEPIPSKCVEVSKEEIEIVLVPALGFDKTHLHRIGYGKGYYDRFLASIPNCPTIGIGFKEQCVDSLPVEPADFPLNAISLF